MNRKQLVIAALFAVVLLTLVFAPLAQQQGGGTYDPWLDYNEDGKVDLNDLHPLGQAYGTLGDSTKNVTIAKHATKTIKAAVDFILDPNGGFTYWDSGYIFIDGYAKATVLISISFNGQYWLRARDSLGPDGFIVEIDEPTVFNQQVVRTFDVMNNFIWIRVWNGAQIAASLYVTVYLMA